MSFKLPVSEVLIGNARYALRVTDKDALDDDAFGNITYAQKRIKVADDQDEGQVLDTLLHEILHGIIHGPNLLELERELEEKVVKVLSGGLLQVFRDNPELISWVLERAEQTCGRTKDASTSKRRGKRE